MRPVQWICKLPQLIVPIRTIQKVCCQLVCLGDNIVYLWEWVNGNLYIHLDKLSCWECVNIFPVMYKLYPHFNLCSNCNLLSSTIIHKLTPNIFGIKPCTQNHQTCKKLIQFFNFPSLDCPKAIATTKFLDQIVPMNFNESYWYFFPLFSVSLLCRTWAKGSLMSWWCFCNMMNFNNSTSTSSSAITQDFNTFSFKVGAFVPA